MPNIKEFKKNSFTFRHFIVEFFISNSKLGNNHKDGLIILIVLVEIWSICLVVLSSSFIVEFILENPKIKRENINKQIELRK